MRQGSFHRFLARFKHPVSLPEDVAQSLGISLSNFVSLETLMTKVKTSFPTKIKKFMKREDAEKAFTRATVKECFAHETLCSFHFNNSWLQFDLRFDDNNRLRRVLLQHKNIPSDEGVELNLTSDLS